MQLPKISTDFVEALAKHIAPPVIEPGYDQEKAMFHAGREDLFNFIKREAPRGWSLNAQTNIPALLQPSCPTCTESTNTTNTSTETAMLTDTAVLWKCLRQDTHSMRYLIAAMASCLVVGIILGTILSRLA